MIPCNKYAPNCKSLNLDQCPNLLGKPTDACRLVELLLVKWYWDFLLSIPSPGHEL